MAKVSTNISLDPALKKSAQELFSDLGMAVTLFLRQAVREQGMPFIVTRAVPNAETRAALEEYAAMRNNPEQYKRYDSFSDLLGEVLGDA